jgi:hypothetical protein
MIDELLDKFLAVARAAFPRIGYLGTYEYTVFSVIGNQYDLRPTDASLPPIPPSPFKPGIPGLTSTLQVGSLVYVTFINSDPARPFIVAVAGPGDQGFTPTSVAIDASGAITMGHASSTVNAGGGFARVLRDGERVSITGLVAGATPVTAVPGGSFIAIDPTVITPGAPPGGYSTVKA